jgi:hypothetical protein
MVYKQIIKKVAKELNLPEPLVKETYNSYWKFVKDTIENIPIKSNFEKEDYNISFNIPFIGKLYLDNDKLKQIHKRIC